MAMQMSLYDASVASYLQTLDALAGVLGRGLSHCRESGLAPEEIVETRLFPDMRPFGFQIQRVVLHSLGAIEAIRSGRLGMSTRGPDDDYAALQALIDRTRGAMRELDPREIDSHEGADVIFETPDARRVFTVEGFLLSFSLPNFHFHATTAYNILRSKGVPLGKLDYMGTLRLKTSNTQPAPR